MSLAAQITAALVAIGLILGIVRLFAAPLKMAGKLILHAALGFASLFLLQLLRPLTGFTLGLNLLNACVIGVLGIPGLILLILLKLVFV